MTSIERRVRALINPYSTAFARWWCYSGRYVFRPKMRKAAGQSIPARRASRHGQTSARRKADSHT